MVGERLDAPQEDDDGQEEEKEEAVDRRTKEGDGGNSDSLYIVGIRVIRCSVIVTSLCPDPRWKAVL